MDTAIINECKSLSLAGKITFPEVIAKLASTGVERYRIDLVTLQGIYFSGDGKSYTSTLDYQTNGTAESFSASEVKNAITDIQQQRIDYIAFLDRVTRAGCTHYEVFIKGRKVIYCGRDGSQHIELFPQADS